MGKKYFAWKNAGCNGENIEWVEMTGKEFLALKRTPENKNRKFIQLGHPGGEEDCIYIEATKRQYDEWHREQSRTDRRNKQKQTYCRSELHSALNLGESEEVSSLDLPLGETDIESEIIRKIETEKLRAALDTLQSEELEIVKKLYLNNATGLSERAVAELMSLPQKTLNNKKMKILKKLKKFLHLKDLKSRFGG